MTDPKAFEAAKNLLFGQQPEPMPSTSSERRSRRSVDPLDKALVKWPGGLFLDIPRDQKPRLIKRNFKHQQIRF